MEASKVQQCGTLSKFLQFTTKYQRSKVADSESRPLLSRPGTPQTYLQPTPSASLLANPSTTSVSTSYLQSKGWLEYVLPDSTVYYIHPSMRVTTDIDLRNPQRLQAVSTYFEGDAFGMAGKGAGKGCEMWLRDVSKNRVDFHPVRMWVDHGRRQVSFDPPSSSDDRSPGDDSKRSIPTQTDLILTRTIS
jgi:hypothetical protein